MRKRVFLYVTSVLVIAAIFSSPALAHSSTTALLQPGEAIELKQEIPVNVVFIGYDKRDNGRRDLTINRQAFLKELAQSSTPVNRAAQFYGLPGRDIGLTYTYKYNLIETNDQFENAFFGWLGQQGTVGEPTYFQQCYSGNAPPLDDGTPDPCNQTKNRREITRTRYIDAPSVEQWLETNTTNLLPNNGGRAYTLYFINWYSRTDFQDHMYTKTDEPDPDTGYNFGEQRPSRKLIAWGGQFGRSWFYDLSAGPESWTYNYIVDDKDLDGDGIENYRMPPVWEYDPRGYRNPSAISSDLGKVTRFIGVNLLFTSSPIYDPLVAAPGPDGKRVVHVEMLQDDPASNGLDYFDAAFTQAKLEALQPYYDWQVVAEETDPIDPGAKRAFQIFNGLLEPTSQDCSSQPPFDGEGSFGPLYCYFSENLNQYVPAYAPDDYVSEVFAFNTTDENVTQFVPLGVADDNYVNGRQTFVYEFDSPLLRDLGYGFTTTTIHEVGHNIGLPHPHDGYDSNLKIDYDPSLNEYLYVFAGTQSNTMMAYIDLNWDFGQFDQDNMYRWEIAGYLNLSSELLKTIVENENVGDVAALLAQAEASATAARADFNAWKYLDGASNAYKTYTTLVTAARQLGIPAGATSAASVPNSDAARPLKDGPRPYIDQ